MTFASQHPIEQSIKILIPKKKIIVNFFVNLKFKACGPMWKCRLRSFKSCSPKTHLSMKCWHSPNLFFRWTFIYLVELDVNLFTIFKNKILFTASFRCMCLLVKFIDVVYEVFKRWFIASWWPSLRFRMYHSCCSLVHVHSVNGTSLCSTCIHVCKFV